MVEEKYWGGVYLSVGRIPSKALLRKRRAGPPGQQRGEIARNVHAHPTLGEAVQEAIHGLPVT